MKAGLAMTALILILRTPLLGQFSPGELSRAHAALEGMENCTKCHEVGKGVSNAKCLGCHEEIAQTVDARHGLHFTVASQGCVACHKEHLGRDARTTRFDEKTFDHAQTGFLLSGKHKPLACEKCHNAKNVAGPVVKKLAAFPHASFVGLSQACVACHKDVHNGTFGANCSSCHSPAAWKPVQHFDHAKTKFALEGKHAAVACEKCHAGIARGDFKTAAFADCTPCHTPPHRAAFTADRSCSTCHAAAAWTLKPAAGAEPFDHARTRYPLAGKHAAVRCEQCHRRFPGGGFAKNYLAPFKACIDCHADKHNGEFAAAYRNDCASCHTLDGYAPSTYTIARHAASRFALDGGHAATLCADCHRKGDKLTFRFASLRCASCHADVHKGAFAAQMKENGCASCHTTAAWKGASFDHARTSFPLAGRHLSVKCADCHKGGTFVKIDAACASCHRDPHMGQFSSTARAAGAAAAGASPAAVPCESCHDARGWKPSNFDHEKQSAFPLAGAHRKVPCASCHKTEQRDTVSFVRFTPLARECASCHAGGVKQ